MMKRKEIVQYLNRRLDALDKLVFLNVKVLRLTVDIFVILFSLIGAMIIRFDCGVPHNYFENFFRIATIFICVKIITIYLFNLNVGLWRYISIVDLKKILKASIFSSILLSVIFYAWRRAICGNFAMSISAIDFMIWFWMMAFIRILVRIMREVNEGAGDSQLIKVVVVGKLDDIDSFIHSLQNYKTGRRIVAAFGSKENSGSTIRGVKLAGSPLRIIQYAKQHDVKEIILIPPYSRKRFLNLLLAQMEKYSYNCSLKIVPNVRDITTGEFRLSNIREVNIDDLLGRSAVKFDSTEVASLLINKSVMVTGGGGSIGSELCHQICQYRPKRLVVFEFSEYNLYQIERILKSKFSDLEIQAVLGDIRVKPLLLKTMKEYSVDVVFHTAAYKHVPLLEKNSLMSLYTNIIGTSNLADCAEEVGVKRVVVISTDKAVRPTSIMGASKRIAERIVLEREPSKTEFVAVRFGNVLGSRGSVIPLFQEQIKNGGPVTVTSKNMIRYFMSIPEAVSLVLQAATVGRDRDIMILEMGQQVNIYEMAKRLIELSGFMPHRDIKIEFTGIRPGEKEYEELLAKEEMVDKTSFERIFVARKQQIDAESVCLDRVMEVFQAGDEGAFRELCKLYIPDNLLG